jgi:integrase
MPRKAKPFEHQGHYYTTAGGVKWRKLCPVAAGYDAALALIDGAEPSRPTLAAAVASYLEHCRAYYVLPSGRTSSEPRAIELALSYLQRALPASAGVEAVNKAAVQAARDLMRPTCSRKTINQHAGRIKRAVRWWCDAGTLPDANAASVLTLGNLPAYRSGATEHDPVEAVPEPDFRAAVALLAEPWASVTWLQWWAGIRPGEACGLRVDQVEYADGTATRLNFGLEHKGGWRGRAKLIPVGPNAAAVLAPWLASARLVPRETVFVTTWTAVLGTPRPAAVGSFAHAVARACVRAKVAPWHPNQIRHAFATRVRAALGLEAAQHALGHARADVTQIYAERNAAVALDVARRFG